MIIRMLFVMGVSIVLLVLGLGTRLFGLQVIDYAFYQDKALTQQTMDKIITPSRGTIYDRNMNELAISVSCTTVCISPATMEADQVETIARGLSQILNVDYNDIIKKAADKKSYYKVIKKKVDADTVDAIRTFIKDNNLKGIELFEDSKRYYPYSTLASQVIGFTDADNNGVYGIEACCESTLKGTPGRIVSARNGEGKEMNTYYEQYYDAQNGQGVVTTIDLTVQQILEKYLKQAYDDNKCNVGTTGIIMNVKTGEILAMADYPNYDLNNPRTVADPEIAARIAQASEDVQNSMYLQALYEQWRIRAINEMYEPGSVFKIITTSIALEEKVVSLSDKFFDPGYKIVSGKRISCWKAGGHGSETFLEGLKNSCNPVFMEVGMRIGSEAFYKYVTLMGLREKTGIELEGEASGVFHKLQNFKTLELAIAAFGQRFKITPLQLITAISGVVNNGNIMKPHIIKAYTDSKGNIIKTVEPQIVQQVVSTSTSQTVRYMMEQVVASGTGRNAYVPGYRVGGKTGTSEKLDVKLEAGETPADKRIASFIGIAPADDPQIAVLILLDEPRGALRQGGQIAAPVVGRVLSEVLPYIGVVPVYTEEELAKMHISVPGVVNYSYTSAVAKLKNSGLTARKVGAGDTVTAQVPAAGTEIAASSEVLLYCGEAVDTSTVTVPSVKGLSYDQAKQLLAKHNLYIKARGAIQTSGSGSSVKATDQDPPSGKQVTTGSVVVVDFVDTVNTADG